MNQSLFSLIVLVSGVATADAAFIPSIGLTSDVPAARAAMSISIQQTEVSGSVGQLAYQPSYDYHVYFSFWNGYYWQVRLYATYLTQHEADHAVETLRQNGWSAWWIFTRH
jgi:hypothetical protein